MDAPAYLESLGIPQRCALSPVIGRLAVVAEFLLGGRRGVVVRPKRGGVSDRYLQILRSDGVDYVVIDGSVPLTIYGRAPDSEVLEPLRALPVESPTTFPPEAVLQVVTDLLLRVARKPANALDFGSRMLAAKLADEQSGDEIFGPAATTHRNGTSVQRLADAAGVDAPAGASGQAVATAQALLAGYRLTPRLAAETAVLVDFIARLADPKIWGIPARAAFALSGAWIAGGCTLVVSALPGIQLLPLREAKVGRALLPLPFARENPLLRWLFPTTDFVDADFLAWTPDVAPDRLFIVPPLGRWTGSSEILRRFELGNRVDGKALCRAPTEALYIEHGLKLASPGALLVAVVPEGLLSSMGHADFRNWLLERVQLLAVLSLPAGSCFTGTAVRCSVLYMKKIDPVPRDYPISMVQADDDDLHDPDVRSKLGAAIDEAVARGVVS